MAWSIGGVTLPVAPTRVTMEYKTHINEIKYPSNRSLVISLGRQVDKLRIEGSIVDSTKTQAQLENTYLEPLRDLVGTDVTINDGNAARNIFDNGSDWILVSFRFSEEGGFTQSFRYTMEFIQGSTHEVI